MAQTSCAGNSKKCTWHVVHSKVSDHWMTSISPLLQYPLENPVIQTRPLSKQKDNQFIHPPNLTPFHKSETTLERNGPYYGFIDQQLVYFRWQIIYSPLYSRKSTRSGGCSIHNFLCGAYIEPFQKGSVLCAKTVHSNHTPERSSRHEVGSRSVRHSRAV